MLYVTAVYYYYDMLYVTAVDYYNMLFGAAMMFCCRSCADGRTLVVVGLDTDTVELTIIIKTYQAISSLQNSILPSILYGCDMHRLCVVYVPVSIV